MKRHEAVLNVILITFETPLSLVINLILMCNCLIRVLLSIGSIDSSLFLSCVGSVLGFFSNMAAGDIPPINPIVIGTLVFLWLSLIINYIVQIKNRHSWKVIILGNVLFLAIVLLVLLVVLPNLHRIVY